MAEYEEAVAGGLESDDDNGGDDGSGGGGGKFARAHAGGQVRLEQMTRGSIEDRLSKLEDLMAQMIEGQKKVMKAVEGRAAR